MSAPSRSVVVAMSGGVDSSVAAALLKKSGRHVVGLFLSLGMARGGNSRARSCCSAEDARDARAVAAALGIPFYSLDFSREFAEIRERFADEYERGRTPSPCVHCNQDLKFGRLLDFAGRVGAGTVATGHYARVQRGQDGPRLLRGADALKDQSYFLFSLTAEQLARAEFPLGELTKDRVRVLAAELGLATSDKPDSQDICFVSGDYRDVLREMRPDKAAPGSLVDTQGAVLGSHDGVRNFTIGQRRGLGVALGEPAYVVALRPETAQVVVGTRQDLLAAGAEISGAVTPRGPLSGAPFRALVRIRARHRPAPATVQPTGEDGARVLFDDPQESVTPGQAAVFYDGEAVLGGGWIDRAIDRTDHPG